jgi:glyoxylase-like metal-dependent hydrolase (beta-lactamase superfamily II)
LSLKNLKAYFSLDTIVSDHKYSMQQITDKIYQINLGAVNAFIVEDNGLTLIDTGYRSITDKIFSAIKNGGKNPADIKQVILTHCHPDHTGSAADIKKRLGVALYAHTLDAGLIEQGIGGRLPFQLSPGIMNWLILNVFIKPHGSTIEPVSIDEELKENDIIPIAGGIQVIHTPGHSAGHISLLLKNEGVLIAGDICANMAGLGLSVVYEDRQLGVKSILKAAAFDFDQAVFGHGRLLAQNASKKLREKFTIANK